MTTSIKNPSDLLASDTKLLAGFQQNQANLPPLIVAGQSHTPADCEAVLQARIAAGTAVVTSKGVYTKTVQANRDEIAETKDFVSAIRDQLILMYSNTPELLAQFGLVPKKKKAAMTAAEQVVVTARRNATRTARGTKGPVQKAKVKGVVPATITIATADASQAPAIGGVTPATAVTPATPGTPGTAGAATAMAAPPATTK